MPKTRNNEKCARCRIAGCRNQKNAADKNTSLFRPRGREMLEKWIQLSGHEEALDIPLPFLQANFKLCQDHFNPGKIVHYPRRKILMSDTLPTYFPKGHTPLSDDSMNTWRQSNHYLQYIAEHEKTKHQVVHVACHQTEDEATVRVDSEVSMQVDVENIDPDSMTEAPLMNKNAEVPACTPQKSGDSPAELLDLNVEPSRDHNKESESAAPKALDGENLQNVPCTPTTTNPLHEGLKGLVQPPFLDDSHELNFGSGRSIPFKPPQDGRDWEFQYFLSRVGNKMLAFPCWMANITGDL